MHAEGRAKQHIQPKNSQTEKKKYILLYNISRKIIYTCNIFLLKRHTAEYLSYFIITRKYIMYIIPTRSLYNRDYPFKKQHWYDP